MFSHLLQFLFPPTCFSCEKEGEYLCLDCKKELKPHPELCPYCHRVSPHHQTCLNCRPSYKFVQWIITSFQYTGVLKKLIRQLKYEHRFDLAGFLAKRLQYMILTNPHLSQALHQQKLLISFVPSHRYRKFFVKGYNQSELLAKKLATLIDAPFLPLRKKIKHTKSQAKLNRQQRLSNLDGAFTLLSWIHLHGDETLVIVDDITTTGATITELADTLQRAHPKIQVRWLVIGRHGR